MDRRARFSQRTGWSLAPNPFAVALAAARARFGADFIDLTESNPTAAGLAYADDALRRALGGPEVLRYAPEPFGAWPAREAVAAYYARRGLPVDPDRVSLVASTSEAYGHLFRLFADPGDAVAVPRPSYPLFTHLADLAGVREAPYRLAYDGAWYLDRASLDGVEGARALLVVSPNNPTGSVFDTGERRFVAEWATEREVAIVSDEVFADYHLEAVEPAAGHRAASLVGASTGLVVSLNGLSKVAGLPQMKVGWMVLSGDDHTCSAARDRLEVMLDALLSVSAPAQALLPVALAAAEEWQTRLRGRLRANRAEVDRLLDGTALRRRHAAGGWTALVDLPATADDEDWCLAFLDAGVAVHPGYFYDLLDRPAFALSLIVDPERLAAGLTRVVDVVDRRLGAF